MFSWTGINSFDKKYSFFEISKKPSKNTPSRTEDCKDCKIPSNAKCTNSFLNQDVQRIMQGIEAEPHSWPWLVHLYDEDRKEKSGKSDSTILVSFRSGMDNGTRISRDFESFRPQIPWTFEIEQISLWQSRAGSLVPCPSLDQITPKTMIKFLTMLRMQSSVRNIRIFLKIVRNKFNLIRFY